MNNQLAYIKSRQSHAINDIDEKTMIYSFEDLYTRENDIFLQWDFKTLRSKYYKDLSVSDGGSIAFEEGQIILGDETTLTYQINKFFPKRNFAISVKYTDDTISNDGLFSIVFNQQPSLLFSIGYNEVLKMYTISYNTISFTDDTFFMVLPSIDNYTTLPSYVVGGENEITLVIDHDVKQEIRLFINDSLVAYNSFDNTKDILFDTNTFMKIYNRKAGVKINHLIIYDILPELFTTERVVEVLQEIRPYPPFSVNGQSIIYNIVDPIPLYPYPNDGSVYYQTFGINGDSYGNGNYILDVESQNNVYYIYSFINQYQQIGLYNYTQIEGLKFSFCYPIAGDGTINTTIDYIFTLPTAIKLNKITWVSRYENIRELIIDYPNMGRIYGINPDDTETLIGELNIINFTFASRYDNFYKNPTLGNRDALDFNCTTDQLFNKFRIKMHSYIEGVSYRIDTKYMILYGHELG